MEGTVNEVKSLSGFPTPLNDTLKHLDEIGDPSTEPHYPVGWAWCGNTPFQTVKQFASHLGGTRIVKHVTSRNNLLAIRSDRDRMVSSAEENGGNDFDYDLTNGRVPKETYRHGVKRLPRYASGAGYDTATRTGRFQLAPDSPGAAVGQPIPNFTPSYSGPAPDLGAHQRGAPPMRFGVKAALR